MAERDQVHCPCCGYDWRGGTGSHCPECGLPREEFRDQYAEGRRPAPFENPAASFVGASLRLLWIGRVVRGFPPGDSRRFTVWWLALGGAPYALAAWIGMAFRFARVEAQTNQIALLHLKGAACWLPVWLVAWWTTGLIVRWFMIRSLMRTGLIVMNRDAERAFACFVPQYVSITLLFPMLGWAIWAPKWPIALGALAFVLIAGAFWQIQVARAILAFSVSEIQDKNASRRFASGWLWRSLLLLELVRFLSFLFLAPFVNPRFPGLPAPP